MPPREGRPRTEGREFGAPARGARIAGRESPISSRPVRSRPRRHSCHGATVPHGARRPPGCPGKRTRASIGPRPVFVVVERCKLAQTRAVATKRQAASPLGEVLPFDVVALGAGVVVVVNGLTGACGVERWYFSHDYIFSVIQVMNGPLDNAPVAGYYPTCSGVLLVQASTVASRGCRFWVTTGPFLSAAKRSQERSLVLSAVHAGCPSHVVGFSSLMTHPPFHHLHRTHPLPWSNIG